MMCGPQVGLSAADIRQNLILDLYSVQAGLLIDLAVLFDPTCMTLRCECFLSNMNRLGYGTRLPKPVSQRDIHCLGQNL